MATQKKIVEKQIDRSEKVVNLKPPVSFACVILAAGRGTRMLSSLPKLMHQVANKPIIKHVIDTCVAAGAGEIVVVSAPDDHLTQAQIAPHTVAFQREALGTGHAALMGIRALRMEHEKVLILNGDMPLLKPETLQLFAQQVDPMTIMTMDLHDPRRFGRVIVDGSRRVEKIVEFKDASVDERAVTLCNTGVYAIKHDRAEDILTQINNNNVAKEYYLTDIVSIGQGKGLKCGVMSAEWNEVASVNTKSELAELEVLMQNRLRQKFLDAGVTLIDPSSVYFSADTKIANDVMIEPHVFIGPDVTIGKGVTIRAFSYIDEAQIEDYAKIGPFARIRSNSTIGANTRIGNFVEIDTSVVGEGVKIDHLSYIGHTRMGDNAKIGGGTITCNYDGFNKNKTVIQDNAFIGSNTILVAPVTVHKNAMTAAGSVVTDDVPVDAMAIARAEQVTISLGAKRYRDKRQKKN